MHHFYFPDFEKPNTDPNNIQTATFDKTAGEGGGSFGQVVSDMAAEVGGKNFQENEHMMTEEDKRIMDVSMFEGDNMVMDNREIRLDPLNEKFFMYLFKALMFTKSSSILYQLLDVINFYIKYETDFQKEIINAQTILWML